MIFSELQKSTTLTWGVKGAFALQIYFFPFCDKGFGEDCLRSSEWMYACLGM